MSTMAEVQVSYDVGNALFRLKPEVMEVETRCLDSKRIRKTWHEGLRRNEELIRSKWGDEVSDASDRHRSPYVRAFEMHTQSLAQYSLERID